MFRRRSGFISVSSARFGVFFAQSQSVGSNFKATHTVGFFGTGEYVAGIPFGVRWGVYGPTGAPLPTDHHDDSFQTRNHPKYFFETHQGAGADCSNALLVDGGRG